MKLIWTKSESSFSRFIRWLTHEDCSHFSILLYDGTPYEIMFESNLLGTHPAFYKSFLKAHTIVHEHKILCEESDEDQVLAEIVEFYDGCAYDYLGALYLGWRKWLFTRFGIEIPERNKWSNQLKYYCEELIVCVKNVNGVPQIPTVNAMRTPHDLWGFFK